MKQLCLPPRHEVTIHAVKYAIMMVMKQRGGDAHSSLVKDCSRLLRTIPVYFVLCPDSCSAQRKRWELDSTTAVLAEERLLVGFNLILGVAEVAETLGTASRPASYEAVADWLSKAKQKSMSVDVVKGFLRIRKRFTAEAVAPRRSTGGREKQAESNRQHREIVVTDEYFTACAWVSMYVAPRAHARARVCVCVLVCVGV